MEDRPQLAPEHRVEPDRRLVEHEDLGVADERAREAHPRLLAPAEVVDAGGGVTGEVDGHDGAVDGIRGCAQDGAEVVDVLAHRQVAVDARGLRHVTDAVAQGR